MSGAPSSDRKPPAWVLFLLRRLVPAELRGDFIGDLEEGYARRLKESGPKAADRWARHQLWSTRPIQLRRAVAQGRTESAEGADFGTELRHAMRSFRARPGVAAMVVATVALAVGATTSVFSVVNGVLLRPLPYPDSERLVRIHQVKESWLESPNSQLRAFGSRFPVSVPTFRDWTEADLGMSAIGAIRDSRMVHQSESGAEILSAQLVTSGFFDVLGVEPVLGRRLAPSDDPPGADPVVVLGHDFWTERYGQAQDAVGRTIDLDGVRHTIVGVMPAGFTSPTGSARIWGTLSEEEKTGERDSQFLGVIGRIANGVTFDAAVERIEATQAALAVEYPDAHGDLTSRVEGLLESIVGDVGRTLWFLLGAVGLVLVIACVNIANVLSISAMARRREWAVKAALGAGRRRLIRGMLTESALLSAIGGLGGVLLAGACLPLMLRVVPTSVPRYGEIGIDTGVLLFGLGATLFTTLVVGSLPAIHASGAQPASMLGGASRGSTGDRLGGRVRSGLVVTEVALAFSLLVGAALLGTSFQKLWSVDRGFDTEGLVVLSTYPDEGEYPEEEDRDRFLSLLRERLRAIPGTQVSAANQVPLTGSMSSTTYEVESDESEPVEPTVVISVVLPEYFGVMSVPLLQGRALTEEDDATAPMVAVVNQAMAEAIWPGESAIGKRLRPSGAPDEDRPWTTVVGVARNVLHQGLDVPAEPKLYVSAWQNHRHPTHWLLRAQGDLEGVTDLARKAVTEVSPATPVRSTQIVEDAISRSVSVPRFRMYFSVGLAGLAGVLALLGVYGVMAFSVDQRTREIGVRMALGARASGVVREVVTSGLRLAVAGIMAGAIGTLLVGDVLSGFLYDVQARDPVLLLGVAFGVAIVSAAAAWLPARRAAAIDPVRVLKSD